MNINTPKAREKQKKKNNLTSHIYWSKLPQFSTADTTENDEFSEDFADDVSFDNPDLIEASNIFELDDDDDEPEASHAVKDKPRKKVTNNPKKQQDLHKSYLKKCYSCNQVGHMIRDCPLQMMLEKMDMDKSNDGDDEPKETPANEDTQKDSVNSDAEKTCGRCHQVGHVRKNCPKPKDEAKPNKAADIQQDSVKSNNVRTCHRCRQIGHVRNECPLRKNNKCNSEVVKALPKATLNSGAAQKKSAPAVQNVYQNPNAMPGPSLNQTPAAQNVYPKPNAMPGPSLNQTPAMHTATLGWNSSLPKGIPRSFLNQQNPTAAIQPQPQPNHGIHVHPQMMPLSNVQQVQTQMMHAPSFVSNFQYHQAQHPDPVGPIMVQTNTNTDSIGQAYSPSDVYAEAEPMDGDHETSQSPDGLQPGEKRQSAFNRLGPMTQPKKPKLTINLLCTKDESVREVVDETAVAEDISKTPFHLRQYILESDSEIVAKYIESWPWNMGVNIRRSVSCRLSKSVMLMEQEKMEKVYERESTFVLVAVTGYPPSWKKEDVLDAVLESVKGKTFIPCFTEFTQTECKFFVLRNASALLCIHKYGFMIPVEDVVLTVTISSTDMSLTQIDFIPRLILRKQLAVGYDGERKLSLKEFTLKPDISHFIYYPLARITNQLELIQIQSTISWSYLTDLDLSCNKLTTIEAFHLSSITPKLKNLDLSYNYIQKLNALFNIRELGLQAIQLEGNPLCHDYIDSDHYIKVLRLIFPMLKEIDGLPITYKGDFPTHKKNFCPTEAQHVVDKFLEIFFPLLDLPPSERFIIEDLYTENAALTITYRNKLRFGTLFKTVRPLCLRSRCLEDGKMDIVEGASDIAKLVSKWPLLCHDPYSFTVDVLSHSDTITIIRIGGIFKIPATSIVQDECILAFSRTVVLSSENGYEYKIRNEMVYWDLPTADYSDTAFRFHSIKPSKICFKLETTPDEELKCKLVEIFMQLTGLEQTSSEKCLETKSWNIKEALEYFTKLLKLESMQNLKIRLEKLK